MLREGDAHRRQKRDRMIGAGVAPLDEALRFRLTASMDDALERPRRELTQTAVGETVTKPGLVVEEDGQDAGNVGRKIFSHVRTGCARSSSTCLYTHFADDLADDGSRQRLQSVQIVKVEPL